MKKMAVVFFLGALLHCALWAQHPFIEAGSSYEGGEDINSSEPAIEFFTQLPSFEKVNEEKPFVIGADIVYSSHSKIITLPLSYYLVTDNKTMYAFRIMVPYVMRKFAFKFDTSQEFSGAGLGDITIGVDMNSKIGEMPIFLQLMIKTPTGKVDNESKENEYTYIPLGTGTWDFALSAGFVKYFDSIAVKGKLGYRLNGTYENTTEFVKQEFDFGNMFTAVAGIGANVSDNFYGQLTMLFVSNKAVAVSNTVLATDTTTSLEANGTGITVLDICPQIDYSINGFVFSAGIVVPLYSAWGEPEPLEMVPGEGIPDPEREIKIKFGFQHPF